MQEHRLMGADKVSEVLGVSKPYAYKLIRRLNEELEGSGCMFIPGKVNRAYLEEKFFKLPKGKVEKMPVYRDKERRTWYVSCINRDFKGVRRHKTKRGFKTKAEAAKWEMEFTAKAGRNTQMLFRDFVDYYEQDRRPRLRESTWLTKEHITKEKLLPFFGEMKLDEVDAADVVRWQNTLVNHRDGNGKPYAPTSLRTMNNQLSAIFNHAVRYYGLPGSPVAKAGKIGSTKGAEMQFWTREEYLTFAEAIMDKPDPTSLSRSSTGRGYAKASCSRSHRATSTWTG